MQFKPQMMVTIKNGNVYTFDIEGYHIFESAVKALGSWFTRWIYIGPKMVVRTDCIESVMYKTKQAEIS